MKNSIVGMGRILFCAGLAVSAAACSGNTSSNDNNGGAGGAGSNTGGAGGLSQAVCDAAQNFMPTDPTAMFDDLEDGNGLVAGVSGRNGSWWISTDGTAGTIQPIADQAPAPEKIPGGRCGSKYAMRVTGQGFTGWGAVLSAGMAYSTQSDSSDLSSFKGLMLWARVGEQNTSAIRVQFQDASTRPEGGQCVDNNMGPTQCYDGFGTQLTPMDTTWRLYKLDFSRMAQRNFGFGGAALDPSTIYDVEFNLDPDSVIDLWVDDLVFYD